MQMRLLWKYWETKNSSRINPSFSTSRRGSLIPVGVITVILLSPLLAVWKGSVAGTLSIWVDKVELPSTPRVLTVSTQRLNTVSGVTSAPRLVSLMSNKPPESELGVRLGIMRWPWLARWRKSSEHALKMQECNKKIIFYNDVGFSPEFKQIILQIRLRIWLNDLWRMF